MAELYYEEYHLGGFRKLLLRLDPMRAHPLEIRRRWFPTKREMQEQARFDNHFKDFKAFYNRMQENERDLLGGE